ncbi:hypothetical protein BO86DRAFT_404181 [Aspergillus japonicus CBS 114.51]|uniref:Uncharacterized protein n=1 Tax=Aspergillus japonicus CBS 114.51 TaxID=1448312 RepID=A0A8T8WMU3_ASPJA|nr:hypothetical protein BO86DRAFT_404181 [Aspergillus japonicus CBS 114.51]RAH76942.1 hypothetical protein BO86DRAFT_404181 [Aspergillus japonicus CBS 114.51]
MLGHQPKNGLENKILYGELLALVSAMRNRAFQLNVDTEEEQEALEDLEDEARQAYPFLFPDEDTFPVLYLSAVGPRHARIFYGEELNKGLPNSAQCTYFLQWLLAFDPHRSAGSLQMRLSLDVDLAIGGLWSQTTAILVYIHIPLNPYFLSSPGSLPNNYDPHKNQRWWCSATTTSAHNAQKWEQNVEVDDSGRYKVACLNATAYRAYEGPLNGIRFWFEQEEYYVVVGCPPWISTKMAADGRWAKNVSKYWDQCWEDTVEPRFICEEWGFTKNDTNMYHVKGWGFGVMEGLHDLERRLGIVLAQTDYENYGRHLVMRIKEGLKALDPTWQKTEDDFDAKYNQDHAKDVVQRSAGGWAHHRDGTTSISYF